MLCLGCGERKVCLRNVSWTTDCIDRLSQCSHHHRQVSRFSFRQQNQIISTKLYEIS